jgi:hypothetical protein
VTTDERPRFVDAAAPTFAPPPVEKPLPPAQTSAPPLLPVPAKQRRNPLIAFAIVAALALIGGAVAAVIAFTAAAPDREPDNPPGTAPVEPAGAPTGLELHDAGSSITLTWTDPSQGTVSFIVAGGQDGSGIRPLHTLLPGATTHTVHGLNPRLNYCFTVAAVYDTNRVAVSDLVCTRRNTTPTPSRSTR